MGGIRESGGASVDLLPTGRVEHSSSLAEWAGSHSAEISGDIVRDATGSLVWVHSPISWAVFLGCNTAARLAKDRRISVNAAGHLLRVAVQNKEIRWAGNIKGRVGRKGGRPEHLYANISCKEVVDRTTTAMRQVFNAMPRLAQLPVPNDGGRAAKLMRAGAERWALGASTWWGRTVTERSSLVHVPHENRAMSQGAFEFVLRTNFEVYL